MHKVISAGQICLDFTPVFHRDRRFSRVDELLVPGKLIRIDPAVVSPGGSVSNTGLALKLLGSDVTLVGKIGDDAFGGILQRKVAEYGAGGLIVTPGGCTSYTTVLAIPGIDRILLNCPGVNDTFCAEDIPDEALRDAELFHFGYPTLARRMYRNGGLELGEMFRMVKARGIATSLDLSMPDPATESGQADWAQILANTLPHVDFFVPSFEELCFMLDRPRYDALAAPGEDITEHLDLLKYAAPLAERCLAMGCGTVLIKCGLSGMYYSTGSRERLAEVGARLGLDAERWAGQTGVQRAFQAEILRSATGAGDVSIAAFLTAAMDGEPPAECVRLAAAEGAASVTSYDTLGGVLPLGEIKRRLSAGWKIMGE